MPRLWRFSLTVGSQLKGLRVIDSRVTLASDEDAERDLKTRFDSRVILASGRDAERVLAPELLLLRVGMLSEI